MILVCTLNVFFLCSFFVSFLSASASASFSVVSALIVKPKDRILRSTITSY